MPALIAIIAGLLYATGALVRTTELRDAGLTVRDTITLVPIEQHLSRGIEVALAPKTLALLVLVLAYAVAFNMGAEWRRRKGAPRRGLRRGVNALLGVTMLAILIYDPVGFGAVLIGGLVALLIVFRTLQPKRVPDLAHGLATFVLAVGISQILYALVDPLPLPRVTAELESGETLRGGLIAHDGTTYYVSTGDDQYMVLTEDRLEAPAVIRSRDLVEGERTRDQSLFELID